MGVEAGTCVGVLRELVREGSMHVWWTSFFFHAKLETVLTTIY